jgi:hypothetical protein
MGYNLLAQIYIDLENTEMGRDALVKISHCRSREILHNAETELVLDEETMVVVHYLTVADTVGLFIEQGPYRN